MSGSTNGILDVNDDITRNINAQTLFNVNERRARQGLVDQRLRWQPGPGQKSTVDGVGGQQLPRSEFRLDQQHADASRAARSSRSAGW